MAAAKYDIITQEGATIGLSMIYKDNLGNPIDISGDVPVFAITDNVNDNTADTVNCAFTTDGTDGEFTLTIPAGNVDGWGFKNGKYTITLNGGNGDTIIYGKMLVKDLKY